MKKIILSNGRVTLVDDEDYDHLSQFRWYQHHSGYAVRSIYPNGRCKAKQVSMHSLLIDRPEGMVIDHIDGNTLNNQKTNLRVCTKRQNTFNSSMQCNNTSGFKGVALIHMKTPKWLASIKYEGKTYRIGCFTDKLDAARAYNKAAKEYFGDFARLNVIPGETPPSV